MFKHATARSKMRRSVTKIKIAKTEKNLRIKTIRKTQPMSEAVRLRKKGSEMWIWNRNPFRIRNPNPLEARETAPRVSPDPFPVRARCAPNPATSGGVSGKATHLSASSQNARCHRACHTIRARAPQRGGSTTWHQLGGSGRALFGQGPCPHGRSTSRRNPSRHHCRTQTHRRFSRCHRDHRHRAGECRGNRA